MNGLDISTNTHVQIDLCVLRDACHELFYVFGAFYVSGMQDAASNKITMILFLNLPYTNIFRLKKTINCILNRLLRNIENISSGLCT